MLNAVSPPTMLWVLGLLLMDVFTVTVRRLARRRSPMSPDRDHIHHILMRRGYSPRAMLALLVAANTFLAAIGTTLWQLGVPDWWIFWSFLLVCAVYFAIFFMPFRLYRLRARPATTMTNSTGPARRRNRLFLAKCTVAVTNPSFDPQSNRRPW